jgi:hypothetical protein
MPDDEQAKITGQHVAFTKALATGFVQEHLGDAAVNELTEIWEEGLVPISQHASAADTYETLYKNWMWLGSCAFRFVREKLGEGGIEDYIRAEVTALKRNNDSLKASLLTLIRAVMPGTAFKMAARTLAYQVQAITPLHLTQLSGSQMVVEIPRCKVLDYPNSEDACRLGCQRADPAWFADQFKVDARFERRDHSCTCTVIPIR